MIFYLLIVKNVNLFMNSLIQKKIFKRYSIGAISRINGGLMKSRHNCGQIFH